MKKIAVIGAGAAGMMAAVSAAQNGAKVTIYEKNEKAGKKIYITGKGRCNVTNNTDTEKFFNNVCSNPKFLYSSVYSFDHDAVMDFFESNGCKLKVERGERVFPVSDHSSDIIATLVKVLKNLGVGIRYGANVTSIYYEDDKVKNITVNKKEKIDVDAVIVATGGLSYPSTGSNGDGYKFARYAGHSIIDTRPSLVPFNIKENWCSDLQGLSLKNVSLRLFDESLPDKKKNKPIYDGFGEMLFTHFGISGPLVLSASTKALQNKEYKVKIDLKPALTIEQLNKRLIREFEENNKKEFRNSLSSLYPSKLIPVIVELSDIDPYKKTSEVSKSEREKLIDITKNLTMTVTSTRSFNEAIVTKGGVNVKEINPSTMESNFRKGLFFAGEVLDLDAYTGGFNLQIAWSTGHLAGVSAACE